MVNTVHEILTKASAETHKAILELHRLRRDLHDADKIRDNANLLREFTRMQNAINNVAFAIRDLSARAPYSLYNDASILIGFFQVNHLVGFTSLFSVQYKKS